MGNVSSYKNTAISRFEDGLNKQKFDFSDPDIYRYHSKNFSARNLCPQKQALLSTYDNYITERQQEKEKRYHYVVFAGFCVLLVGLILCCVEYVVIGFQWYRKNQYLSICTSIGIFFCASALLIMALVPPDNFNFDEVMSKKPFFVQYPFAAMGFIFGITAGGLPPYTGFISSAAAFLFLIPLGKLAGDDDTKKYTNTQIKKDDNNSSFRNNKYVTDDSHITNSSNSGGNNSNSPDNNDMTSNSISDSSGISFPWYRLYSHKWCVWMCISLTAIWPACFYYQAYGNEYFKRKVLWTSFKSAFSNEINLPIGGVAGAFCLAFNVIMVTIFYFFTQLLEKYQKKIVKVNLLRTGMSYAILYLWAISIGVILLILGWMSYFTDHSSFSIVNGCMILFPYVVVYLIGPSKVFRFLSVQFDKKWRKKDGAFFAELVNHPEHFKEKEVRWIQKNKNEKDEINPQSNKGEKNSNKNKDETSDEMNLLKNESKKYDKEHNEIGRFENGEDVRLNFYKGYVCDVNFRKQISASIIEKEKQHAHFFVITCADKKCQGLVGDKSFNSNSELLSHDIDEKQFCDYDDSQRIYDIFHELRDTNDELIEFIKSCENKEQKNDKTRKDLVIGYLPKSGKKPCRLLELIFKVEYFHHKPAKELYCPSDENPILYFQPEYETDIETIFKYSPRDIENSEKEDLEKIRVRCVRKYDETKDAKIDFFVSHAWPDHANEEKAKIIIGIATEFKEKSDNKKFPTFWIDAICVNRPKKTQSGAQDKDDGINDQLKQIYLLPVIISSSNFFIALFGGNYIRRLWCVWELYALFSLSVDAFSLDNIGVYPLKSVIEECKEISKARDPMSITSSDELQLNEAEPNEENEKSINRNNSRKSSIKVANLTGSSFGYFQYLLRSFDVEKTGCFDPNETIKLLKIIQIVGKRRFKSNITNLAQKIQDEGDKKMKKKEEAVREENLNVKRRPSLRSTPRNSFKLAWGDSNSSLTRNFSSRSFGSMSNSNSPRSPSSKVAVANNDSDNDDDDDDKSNKDLEIAS